MSFRSITQENLLSRNCQNCLNCKPRDGWVEVERNQAADIKCDMGWWIHHQGIKQKYFKWRPGLWTTSQALCDLAEKCKDFDSMDGAALQKVDKA